MARLIGIDLFAGAGGLSLGFEQAGFDIVAAVEYDPIHAAVHAYNFPKTKVFARTVVGLTGEDIRRSAGLGRKRIDVVFGGAPCQGFSLIGQRALDDPRNKLVGEFVRIVGELNPAYFVFENVKGLTIGRHSQFLDELIEAFEGLGYSVRKPWSVLNALSYGVPQNRERLFLIGARRGNRLPSYPAPTTRLSKGAGALRIGPTCRDALGDLPNADSFEALWTTDAVRVKKWGKVSSWYARELRCLENNSWHHGYIREWDPLLLTSSLRTEHTDISRRRFLETPQGEVEPISRFFKLAENGVSNTLRAGTDSARGAFTSPRPIHFEFGRCVTVREMARLQGFPDWFRFHCTKWHGARQVGNSVPPPLARAVAEKVREAIGVSPENPSETLKLGPSELLQFGMADAAAHFGVVVPIGRRNRKTGSTKRSQYEIEAQRLAKLAF